MNQTKDNNYELSEEKDWRTFTTSTARSWIEIANFCRKRLATYCGRENAHIVTYLKDGTLLVTMYCSETTLKDIISDLCQFESGEFDIE